MNLSISEGWTSTLAPNWESEAAVFTPWLALPESLKYSETLRHDENGTGYGQEGVCAMTETGLDTIPASKRLDVLLEQYKLLEERRKAFGREFMQTVGFILALLGIVVGLLGESSPLLHSILRAAGVTFFILAFLAYRLGKRQDHCEETMAIVESWLEEESGGAVARLPQGARRFGARLSIVLALIVAGILLLVLPLRF